jgi:soluble lytic murein transglycosylase-like protein
MGRSRVSPLVAFALLLFAAAPAAASVPHTVQSGESLFSIAAASNFTTRSLAAANGLAEDAQVMAGSTIQIPSEQEAAAALGGAAPVGSAPAGTAPVGTETPASEVGQGAPDPLGAYTVRYGDTLSSIAARSRVDAGQLAWMNGLDPAEVLLAGTVLKLPAAAPLAQNPPPTPAPPPVVPDAAPHPTPGHVTSAEIGQVAAGHGLAPSLVAAVAWQESGFNNAAVSPANARGVMQILPGTWQWIQDRLASGSLDPSSPLENVHAGTMYLGQLLKDSAGDEAQAIASYYQGASSVRRLGLLPDTQRYVANVMELRGRFGG